MIRTFLFFAWLGIQTPPTISGRVVDEDGVGVAGVTMLVWTYGDWDSDGDVDLRDVAFAQRIYLNPRILVDTITQLRGPSYVETSLLIGIP